MKTVIVFQHKLLTWLLVGTVAILIVPVTMQIVSCFTFLLPSCIWTEELSRFLFIWMVLLSAMVAVREGTHFDVGLCLMIACSVAKVRLRFALKDILIMQIPMLLVLLALIIWPDIALFLPRLIAPELVRQGRHDICQSFQPRWSIRPGDRRHQRHRQSDCDRLPAGRRARRCRRTLPGRDTSSIRSR